MITDQLKVTVDRLVIDEKANARKRKYPSDDVETMASSIKAHGIIQPLAVRPPIDSDVDLGGQLYRVFAGGRRTTALNLLLERGEIDASFEVPIIVSDDEDTAALEKSLAENIIRSAMSPVEEHKAFADLFDRGHTVRDIALRFGMSEKTVKQRLALGKLHPDILEAVAEEELGLDHAEDFTLEPDLDRQKEVFDMLVARKISTWNIKDELVGKGIKADSRKARFIGEEAYKEAGGEIVTDLFSRRENGEAYWVSPAAISKAYDKRKTEITAENLEAGWSFVIFDDDEEAEEQNVYNWKRIRPEAKEREPKDQARFEELEAYLEPFDGAALWQVEPDEREKYKEACEEYELLDAKGYAFTAEQMAGAGVFIGVRYNESYIPGIVRPGSGTAGEGGSNSASSAAKEAPKKDPLSLTAKVSQQISVDLTKAVREAVRTDADMALALLCAQLDHSKSAWNATKPLTVDVKYPSDVTNYKDIRYDTVLKRYVEMDREALLSKLAELTADLVNLGDDHFIGQGSRADEIRKLVVNSYKVDPTGTFDPDAFFDGSSKTLIETAYAEMKPDSGKITGKKKEIAALAAETAKATGWLPKQLRFDGYTGPGAPKPKAPAKRKPKAKAKAKEVDQAA